MHIHVQHVNKSFQTNNLSKNVLKDINLSIPAHEKIAILGPSGSGKSTLLHILGGLDTVTTGSITIDNFILSEASKDEITQYRRSKVGFIFQFYNLISNLTVYENIEVCAKLNSDHLNINKVLQSVSLYEHKDKFPAQISGGQQQRCALARAVIKKPQLLLCDEPTGALDSVSSREVLQLLEHMYNEYHTTLIIVTHNVEIAKMCNRVIEIKDGSIVKNELNPHVIPAQNLEL